MLLATLWNGSSSRCFGFTTSLIIQRLIFELISWIGFWNFSSWNALFVLWFRIYSGQAIIRVRAWLRCWWLHYTLNIAIFYCSGSNLCTMLSVDDSWKLTSGVMGTSNMSHNSVLLFLPIIWCFFSLIHKKSYFRFIEFMARPTLHMINDWKRWKRIHQENKGSEKKDISIPASQDA